MFLYLYLRPSLTLVAASHTAAAVVRRPVCNSGLPGCCSRAVLLSPRRSIESRGPQGISAHQPSLPPSKLPRQTKMPTWVLKYTQHHHRRQPAGCFPPISRLAFGGVGLVDMAVVCIGEQSLESSFHFVRAGDLLEAGRLNPFVSRAFRMSIPWSQLPEDAQVLVLRCFSI